MSHDHHDHSSMNHDHGAMDHGNHMDHSKMDHSSMNHGSDSGGMMDHMGMAKQESEETYSEMKAMAANRVWYHCFVEALCSRLEHKELSQMYFHFGHDATILFKFWTISSDYGLIGSMIGICIMAVLYEGLKYYREHLFWSSYNALQYRSVQMPADKNSSDRVVHVVGEVIHKQPPSMLSKMHGFQTFLHVIQMVISYFLMLIFMTYNVYLCAAVVVGAGIGYFLFGWKKSVIVDVTEHCH